MSTVPTFGVLEDIGDAFAKLYDALETIHPTVGQLEAYRADPAYQRALDATRHAIDAISDDLWMSAQPLADALNAGPPALLGALTAIDLALSRADPTTPPPIADLVTHRVLRRLTRQGSYQLTHGAGAILRKRTRPTRPSLAPESLREEFNLLRVSPATWSTVEHLLVRPALDHAVTKLDTLHIASLPMGAAPVDVAIASTQTHASRLVYVAAPAGSIGARVPHAANALERSGVDLALLPEVTLNVNVLEGWQHHSNDDLPTWILVGTGPVHPTAGPMPGASAPIGTTTDPSGNPFPPNRAVLLHGPSGEVIAAQDKQFGFTIPPSYLAPYGLSHAPAQTHDEGIEAGNRLTVVESNAGRFAMFVCEDLGRLPQLAAKVQELGITHILTPILATPILLRRWQQNSAQYLTTHVGTTTVVVNSLNLGRFHPMTTRGAYTMMVIKPDHGRGSAVTCPHRNPDARHMSDVEDALTLRTDNVAVC